MTTSIAVKEETKDMLEQVKEELNSPNFDDVIRTLIAKTKKPEKSMYGAGGKMPLKEILKDLRDKSDRY